MIAISPALELSLNEVERAAKFQDRVRSAPNSDEVVLATRDSVEWNSRLISELATLWKDLRESHAKQFAAGGAVTYENGGPCRTGTVVERDGESALVDLDGIGHRVVDTHLLSPVMKTHEASHE